MNAFRFLGDMTHLFSVLVLLLKIYATKSCSGKPVVEEDAGAVPVGVRGAVPGPVHRLHLALQHGDEDRLHHQLGGDRVVHAAPPAGTRTYDKEQDTFRHSVLVAATFVLALIFNERFTLREVMSPTI
ncbi:hypothetical protein PR202_ga05738 [Eleusine coracana subsp. coracana]|uniref:Uncharacterized protein n=1 Tax=Eleusine coracana subsp. coracana TaxID=191504 RepID=A0AAV5BT17_ELECO|nr:hypothetical protein PR202_ga05738 [Eleusine coracana subsp. coracana]